MTTETPVRAEQLALEYLAQNAEADGFTDYAAWLRAGCPEQYPSAGADDWERPDDEIAMYLAAHKAGLAEAAGIADEWAAFASTRSTALIATNIAAAIRNAKGSDHA